MEDRIHTGKKRGKKVILGIILNFNVIRKIILNFLQYIKQQFHISGFIFSKFLSGQQSLHLKIASFYRGGLSLLCETSKSPAVKPNQLSWKPQCFKHQQSKTVRCKHPNFKKL